MRARYHCRRGHHSAPKGTASGKQDGKFSRGAFFIHGDIFALTHGPSDETRALLKRRYFWQQLSKPACAASQACRRVARGHTFDLDQDVADQQLPSCGCRAIFRDRRNLEPSLLLSDSDPDPALVVAFAIDVRGHRRRLIAPVLHPPQSPCSRSRNKATKVRKGSPSVRA